ncbi:hypothetical protein M8J76_012653 [Diaphorina citri]|nr:hypothetical protein M8J76_012653 [Diaphorina citri]
MSKKQKIDPDFFLALTLQKKFNEEYKKEKDAKGSSSNLFESLTTKSSQDTIPSPVRKKPNISSIHKPNTEPSSSVMKPTSSSSLASRSSNNQRPSSQTMSLNDSQWEVIDPTPDIHGLFVAFAKRFFQDRLGSVEVKWSKRMTSCAGVCRFKGRRDRSGRGIGEVTISLSEPLLKLRPRSDLVNTLLHEMIHAYLFLFTENPNRTDRDDHEVNLYKQHWWQCNGPCRHKRPFFGLVKRATNRAPGKYDFWFANHQAECGGEFIKIKAPSNFKERPRKNKENTGDPNSSSSKGHLPANNNKPGPLNTQGKPGPLNTQGKSGPLNTQGKPGSLNIHGFGNSNQSNTKHLPTPGQPKIVGLMDLRGKSTPTVDNTKKPNLFKPARPANPSPNNSGHTLGAKSSNPPNSFGGFTLGTKPSNRVPNLSDPAHNKYMPGTSSPKKRIAHTPKNNGSGYIVGDKETSPRLNSNSNRPNITGAVSGIGANNSGSSLGNSFPRNSASSSGNSANQVTSRSSNPIGSKLLDKLNFDSRSGGGGQHGGSGGASSSRGGSGGTRMNKGTGTLVVNKTKSGTETPNETLERITKPVNKTERENRLNIDHFKPFMGQGQTLGGGDKDRNQSRLLANIIGSNSSNANTKASDNQASSNKRMCLGDRSLHSQPSTSSDRSLQSGLSTSSSFKFTPKTPSKTLNNHQKSQHSTNTDSPNSNQNSSTNSSHSNSTRNHLKWDLTDEEMSDDYEYKKLNSSFTDNETETNKVDRSYEEMDRMMNDADLEVFNNIPDDTLHGDVERHGVRQYFVDANDVEDQIGNGDSMMNQSVEDLFEDSDDDDDTANKRNDDDIINKRDEDDLTNNKKDDENDETHCPVCNKAIARNLMNEHLDNCLELSQVFENVVLDDDDDDDDEDDDDDIAIVSDINMTELVDRQSNSNASARSNSDSDRTSSDSARTNSNSSRTNSDSSHGKVKCPICDADILESHANEHIDLCLVKNMQDELE